MSTPWIDAYRPKDFDQVAGNPKAVRALDNLVRRNASIPNLLLCGPPGCGKTTCINILCDRVIGNKNDSRILRLSSFDGRGVDQVRTTVKNFARGRVRVEEGNPRIAKIVILDEADSMTPDALQAMRRVMEANSATTRFILVCNESTKIIEPIQSRCAILRFSKVGDDSLYSRLVRVCGMAGVDLTPEGIRAVVRVAAGDARVAVNELQKTVRCFGTVTEENVYRLCDNPQPRRIVELVASLGSRDSLVSPETTGEGFLGVVRSLRDMCDDGRAPSDIVSTFLNVCAEMDVDEGTRVEILKAVGLAQTRVLSGVSTHLQLVAMCRNIALAFEGSTT